MKKMIALVVALITVLTIPTVAFAANQTVLTTTVPAATYTLNVPADQEIPFGTTKMDIGELTITNASGFASGKNIEVTFTKTDFTCPNTSTTIPFDLVYEFELVTSSPIRTIIFTGLLDGSVSNSFYVGNTSTPGKGNGNLLTLSAESADWGKALGGEYTATITFTAEVVAE